MGKRFSFQNFFLDNQKKKYNFIIRFQKQQTEAPKYKPIALGGLWKGTKISEVDIEEIREEMWGSLEKKEL